MGATRLEVSFCWWKMTRGCSAAPKINFFMDFDEWRLEWHPRNWLQLPGGAPFPALGAGAE